MKVQIIVRSISVYYTRFCRFSEVKHFGFKTCFVKRSNKISETAGESLPHAHDSNVNRE